MRSLPLHIEGSFFFSRAADALLLIFRLFPTKSAFSRLVLMRGSFPSDGQRRREGEFLPDRGRALFSRGSTAPRFLGVSKSFKIEI